MATTKRLNNVTCTQESILPPLKQSASELLYACGKSPRLCQVRGKRSAKGQVYCSPTVKFKNKFLNDTN